MKYIDAGTISSLRQGIMDFLDLTEEDLLQLFCTLHLAKREAWELVEEFLEDFVTDETLEFLQMFHLTRRLTGTDIHENNNLEQLLLNAESSISRFFKKHNVTFGSADGHIVMYYNGDLQILDDKQQYYGPSNIPYIKSRLGYYNNQDYCVNGFAFKSYLDRSDYYRRLSKCPEIVENIGRFLGIKGIDLDYYNNSKYYCIEYLIPISEVVFDIYNPPISAREKTITFLKYSILRLYDDWKKYDFKSDDNLIFRLSDKAEINKDWFVRAEEIKES